MGWQVIPGRIIPWDISPTIIVKSGSRIQIRLRRCISCARNIPMGIPDSLRTPYSSAISTCYSCSCFLFTFMLFTFSSLFTKNNHLFSPSLCIESIIICRHKSIIYKKRQHPILVFPVKSILLLKKLQLNHKGLKGEVANSTLTIDLAHSKCIGIEYYDMEVF